MKNLFSKNLDIIDYVTNSDLEKVANLLTNLSDDVKNTYIPEYEEVLAHKNNDFAVIIYGDDFKPLKKYACFNPGLTEININLLVNDMHVLPDELVKTAGQNLVVSAKKFNINIPEELKMYDSSEYINRDLHISNINEAAYLEKISSKKDKNKDNKVYALHDKYPIDSKKNIKKCAEWFDRNHTKLEIYEIQEFVENITKQAEVLEIKLNNPNIEKYANLTNKEFNENFYNYISIRKDQLKITDDEGSALLNDLIKKADDLGVEKTACVLELIDKELGLDQYYGSTIELPISSVYKETSRNGMYIRDQFVTEDMLKTANVDDLSIVMGNDLTTELVGPNGLNILNSLSGALQQEVLNIIL